MAEHTKQSTMNPNPALYKPRQKLTFAPEDAQALGITERAWDPKEVGRNKHIFALRDLDGYQPLRMAFDRPALPEGRDFTDDWFEKLLAAVRVSLRSFCTEFFGAQGQGETTVTVDSAGPSPWSSDLPPAFLLYCNDIARADADGGWDALLRDPAQRAALVSGVLAKVLDEHIFAPLYFGGYCYSEEILWVGAPSRKQDPDGYAIKWDRAQLTNGWHRESGSSLGSQFWKAVDECTAKTAQLLVPVLNMQWRMHNRSKTTHDVPRLRAFYQQLHDIVALAGYASTCLARSPTIFEFCFPEPGQLWHVDQDRDEADEADEAVKANKADKAGKTDKTKTTTDNLLSDRIKIVTWPRITRFKPEWGGKGLGPEKNNHKVKSATRTILHKSSNVYYCRRSSSSSSSAHPSSGSGSGSSEPQAQALTVFEHVRQAKKRGRWAARLRVALVLSCVVGVLLTLTYVATWHAQGRRAAQQQLAQHAGQAVGGVVFAYHAVVEKARTAVDDAVAVYQHWTEPRVIPLRVYYYNRLCVHLRNWREWRRGERDRW